MCYTAHHTSAFYYIYFYFTYVKLLKEYRVSIYLLHTVLLL